MAVRPSHTRSGIRSILQATCRLPLSTRTLSSSTPRSLPPKYNRFPTGRPLDPRPPILSDYNRRILEIPQEGGSQGRGRGGPGNGPQRDGFWGFWDALDGRKRLVLVGAGGAGVYYVYHLEQVKETGRWRFMDVSPSSERTMAQQSFTEMLNEYRPLLLSPNDQTTRYVRKVAGRIVRENGLGRMKGDPKSTGGNWGWEGEDEKKQDEVEWEVFVVDDNSTKNAFVLPGGKIFVFSGILPICANEDGLASVLGHEIAHQVARHSAERMSSLKVLMFLGFVLEAVGLDVGISRLLLTFLLQLPNSRRSESEADFIGLRLMSKACFDPREAPQMWVRMESSDTKSTSGFKGAANLDFMSTHPANQKRIKALDSWLPEALTLRASSSCADTSRQFEGFQASQVGQWGMEKLGRGRMGW